MYHIDSSYGAAGDMVLGAFIDLGIVGPGEVKEVLESAGGVFGPTEVNILKVDGPGPRGTRLDIRHGKFSGITGRRMRKWMEQGCDTVGLGPVSARMAISILDTILLAESRVHGEPVDDVHLHETGSPDTLVDIIGTAFFYERLRLHEHEITGTPVSLGRGKVRIEHGLVDVPAPATALIVADMECRSGLHDGEMTTPTGAAILANLLTRQCEKTPFEPVVTGRGFGTRSFDGRPGSLTIMAVP